MVILWIMASTFHGPPPLSLVKYLKSYTHFPVPGLAKAAKSPVNVVPISQPTTIGYALSRETIPRPQIGVKIAKMIELD